MDFEKWKVSTAKMHESPIAREVTERETETGQRDDDEDSASDTNSFSASDCNQGDEVSEKESENDFE